MEIIRHVSEEKISSNANFSEIRTRITMESDLWLYLQ